MKKKKTPFDFKNDILKDCYSSIDCILETIHFVKDNKIVKEDFEYKGRYVYLLDVNYYRYGSYRILDDYANLSIGDIHFAVMFQETIRDIAFGFMEAIIRIVNEESLYDDDTCKPFSIAISKLLDLINSYIGNFDLRGFDSKPFSIAKRANTLPECIEQLVLIKLVLLNEFKKSDVSVGEIIKKEEELNGNSNTGAN